MKTQFIITISTTLFILNIASAQGIINQGTITNSSAAIRIANYGPGGHYTSQTSSANPSGGIINPIGTASLFVYGNWVNNSPNTGFNADAGTVFMDGINVNIGGTNPTIFYNLTLRNGGVKTLTNNISVGGKTTLTGSLNLTNAELNLNTYTLTITNPTMTIARTTGYINSEPGISPFTQNVWPSAVTWSMQTTTGARTIPFGVSGAYIPVTFNKSNAVNTNITVSTRSATAANNTPLPSAVTHMNVPNMSVTQANDGTNTTIDRWWYITPSTPSTSPVSLDLNFTYRGVENTATGCPQNGNFGAQYWVNYSASNYGWKQNNAVYGTWPGITTGTQGATTTTGLINLPDGTLQTSYWVLSCSANPLPIELVLFNVLCQNNGKTLLQWKTATEANALRFDIQKSTNAIDFTTIANIPAQYPYGGNYSFIDDTKNKGTVYYRLKMIDKDGSFKYSSISDVNTDKCNNIRTQIYAYEKDLVANIITANTQSMRLMLYDALGRILLDKNLEIQEGVNTFKFPIELAKSIYFVKLVDSKNQIIQIEKVLIGE